jgi:hypothetical protein
MITGYLVDRQRQAVPYDRRTMRRGESSGGIAVADPRTLAVGIEDERERFPATVFDGGIVRDRGPYVQKDRAMAAGDNWVNWSTGGPVRPSIHERNVTFRTMVGNSASRFPQVDTPTGGMHTMTAGAVSRTVPRYVTTPQMVGARIGRLQPGQYSGQTYSQTTRLQGGGRPR